MAAERCTTLLSAVGVLGGSQPARMLGAVLLFLSLLLLFPLLPLLLFVVSLLLFVLLLVSVLIDGVCVKEIYEFSCVCKKLRLKICENLPVICVS